MKKKIFIILVILAVAVAFGVAYLNRVVFPVKVKSLIIGALEKETGKKVSIDSLQLNVFKGLVVRNLVISDNTRKLLSIRQASCSWVIPAIFKRKFIIPAIRLDSAQVFLERRRDNTFNLQELFPKKAAQNLKTGFGVFIYKIVLVDSRIDFTDSSFPAAFHKAVDNINLILSLSLPAGVKFNLKAQVPGKNPLKIGATGEFKIPRKELTAKISLKDFSPGDFAAYYGNYGISIAEGLADALIDARFKEGVITLDLAGQARNFTFSKDKITVNLSAGIDAGFKYGLQDKRFSYSGSADILDASIAGAQYIERIDKLKGKVKFSDAGIWSDNLTADILGLAVEAKANLTDFAKPYLKVRAASSLPLDVVQKILKDKFQVNFTGSISGKCDLALALETKLPVDGAAKINANLDIINASFNPGGFLSAFTDINGRLEFGQNHLKWPELKFKYQDIPCQTSGVLTDFSAPAVEAKLLSENLFFESRLSVSGNLINVAQVSGKYFNSGITASGSIDKSEPGHPLLDIGLNLDVELADIKEAVKKSKEKLEAAHLSGKVSAKIKIKGDAADIKSCFIKAQAGADTLSAYGLKSGALSLGYYQENGLAEVSVPNLDLYEGKVASAAKINLNSKDLPYWIEADIRGLNLGKLKQDTPAKDKDISGTLLAQVKINGFSADLSKLSGAGSIFVSEGRLWELNLFKGLGELLFTKDFSNIIFNEGQCGFLIRDKFISTDNLKLKSNLANLSGNAKIGFDGSLESALNVEVLDETAPLSGTFKDVTTAIIGQAGRFGVIMITGTLKEPQYKFKPAVVDMLRGLKEAIFGEPAR